MNFVDTLVSVKKGRRRFFTSIKVIYIYERVGVVYYDIWVSTSSLILKDRLVSKSERKEKIVTELKHWNFFLRFA